MKSGLVDTYYFTSTLDLPDSEELKQKAKLLPRAKAKIFEPVR